MYDVTEARKLVLAGFSALFPARAGGILAAVVAGYVALVLYLSIVAFDRPTPWYHAQVSYQLVLAAALFLLPFLLFPALRSKPLFSDPWAWFFAATALIAATIFSVDPVVSVSRLRLIFGVVLFACVAKIWFEKTGRIVVSPLLFSIAFVHAAILTLVLYAYAVAEGDLGDFTTWLPYHSHIRHLGYHGVVAASCGLAISVLQPRFRLVGGFLATYALFGLIYFGSRGALLTAMAFLIVALVFSSSTRLPLLATAIVCFAVAWGAANTISSMKANHIGTVAERSTSTASVGSRIHLWTDSLKAIAKRPLLGYGPEGYQVSNCCAPGHVQAHNSIIQTLIETGIIGLLAFLWLGWVSLGGSFVGLFRESFCGRRNDPELATVAAIIISLLAYSMIDGIFYHVIPLMIFAILCALFCAVKNMPLQNDDQ